MVIGRWGLGFNQKISTINEGLASIDGIICGLLLQCLVVSRLLRLNCISGRGFARFVELNFVKDLTV